MSNKHYHIGFVLSKPGLTSGQTEEVLRRLKEHAKALGAGWTICIWIAASDGLSSGDLWPAMVKALDRAMQTEVCDLPGDPTALQLFHEMREYDEVWCLPAKGQARLTRARVCQLYYMAQESGDHQIASRFKWIPHWTGEDKLTKGK